MVGSQESKFRRSWFLFWRSKEARKELADLYRRLEHLKADIRVGGLVEKIWRFSQVIQSVEMEIIKSAELGLIQTLRIGGLGDE